MMKIDIERLINVITEENNAYSDYIKSGVNLHKGDFKEFHKRKEYLDYACHFYREQHNVTISVFEVFRFDTEQRSRLYIMARAVNRWRILTNWEKLIPDSMKRQIARFVFGDPFLDTWQKQDIELNDDQLGPFEIL